MLGQALCGTTVLDLSQGIAGPHCACLLGDLGARVVKIEPPEGDWARSLGEGSGGTSPVFHAFNRGKEGVVLDIKTGPGRRAVARLAQTADVIVESNRPSVLQRFGLDYAELAARRPELIYVSLTGFGQSGPYSARAATDSVVQAYSGFALGASASAEPVRIRFGLIDVSAGLYASHAALAAYVVRLRTGRGQHLDINLAHAAAALQSYKIAEAAAAGPEGARELAAGIGTYRTTDGYIVLSAVRDKHLLGMLEVIGLRKLLEDSRFATRDARMNHQGELHALVAAALRAMPSAHWTKMMDTADLPCQEVLSYAAFRADPHARFHALVQEAAYGDAACLPTVRCPGLVAAEFQCRPAPRLGEHTDAVLARAGIDDGESQQSAGAHATRRN